MAEKEPILKERIEHSGLFDFPALYSFAHSWWSEGQYGVNEDKYSEKVNGDKRDITVEWKITKDISDYFKYEIKIKFEISNLVEVEVEVDGEKKKMNKGKILSEISGTLLKDKDGKWESSPFNRFLRDVYNKYVIPARIKTIADKLASDVRDFKEELKSFMELTGKR
jgi:hypothetical protein